MGAEEDVPLRPFASSPLRPLRLNLPFVKWQNRLERGCFLSRYYLTFES
jgi:hypothetical protein